MLRDKSLIPLSHQHQHVLALCVRIERASPVPASDLGAWQGEIVQLFQSEIEIHFAAEEQVIFPAARRFEQLVPLVEGLLKEHALLRDGFARTEAGTMCARELLAFGQSLSAHIRREERQLFEQLQKSMNAADLLALGKRLDEALKDTDQRCILPTETTRLRPRK
jgi:iron-sulfur cluster repair protein YtfE (RIC family)